MPSLPDGGSLSGAHLVTVFEAVNTDLKEVYVATTQLLSDALGKDFLARPPKAVAHWMPEHRVLFRCIEYSIAVSDAEAFIDHYSKSDILVGWKVFQGSRTP
ncbi:MAG: hypothetical protein HYZ75_14000 [Elusimicrobia bacterium]|nr:hypothetical protein [Elusimicrobiota bacterium]